MNIFVAKLSPNTTGEDLRELFSEYGEVKSANVIMDRDTGQSKRFGFVEMANQEEALKAIDDLDGSEYDHSEIVVKKAKPREDNGGGSRRPGGGGGFKRDNRGGGGYGGGNRGGFNRGNRYEED
ncbi:MAG: RNA recognition motif domain-containing protein [Candidatus Cyclobacteriaceae bacterium M2_1C_046]